MTKTTENFIEEAVKEFEEKFPVSKVLEAVDIGDGQKDVITVGSEFRSMPDVDDVISFLRKKLTEQAQKIVEMIDGRKRSLLADAAYSGGKYPKKYIAFQESSDMHYGSHNEALSAIQRSIKEEFGLDKEKKT